MKDTRQETEKNERKEEENFENLLINIFLEKYMGIGKC
jgi:hypothetical protein